MNILMKIIFNFFSQRDFSINIIKILAKLRSFWILNQDKRREVRNEAFYRYCTNLYGYQVLHTAKSVGEGFWCNGFSYVNENTILKEHVSFNGMKITGKGNVTIGKHFHSIKHYHFYNQSP